MSIISTTPITTYLRADSEDAQAYAHLLASRTLHVAHYGDVILRPHLSKTLPRYLYHIEHADSQAVHPGGGQDIIAADSSSREDTTSHLRLGFIEMERFTARAQEHQNWGSRRPSFFISAFEDFSHARNWGLKRRRKGPVYMYTIDTTKLPKSGQWVFWLENHNEYLFVDRIPGAAIVVEQEITPLPGEMRDRGTYAKAHQSFLI